MRKNAEIKRENAELKKAAGVTVSKKEKGKGKGGKRDKKGKGKGKKGEKGKPKGKAKTVGALSMTQEDANYYAESEAEWDDYTGDCEQGYNQEYDYEAEYDPEYDTEGAEAYAEAPYTEDENYSESEWEYAEDE